MRKRTAVTAALGTIVVAGGAAFGIRQRLVQKQADAEFLREFAIEFASLLGYVNGRLAAAANSATPADKARELASFDGPYRITVTTGIPGIPDSADFRLIDASFTTGDKIGVVNGKVVGKATTLKLLADWLDALEGVQGGDVVVDGNELTFWFSAGMGWRRAVELRIARARREAAEAAQTSAAAAANTEAARPDDTPPADQS